MNLNAHSNEEVILSEYKEELWLRRDLERMDWIESPKIRKRSKVVRWLYNDYVDEELYPALHLLNQLGITTEYSCAGVSVLDEPKDHSLYAYVTLTESPSSTLLIQFIMRKMNRRILVTYEPNRKRYDLSSFFIKHNRSFCLFLYYFTLAWEQSLRSKET